MTEPVCQLYLITPPKIELVSFADKLAEAIDAGNVACVQLRLKEASEEEIMAACDVLRPVVQERDVAFLLNDNPRLAAKMGCDGVHIGQEDGSYQEARDYVGKDAIVGVTCHNSRDLAFAAGEMGADYVAFGAFFSTQTKEAKHQADLETLEAWNMMTTVPSVAIGGITVDNCAPLVKAGADFLAVVAGVWDYSDGPGEAVRAFDDTIREASSSRS